MSKAHSIHRQNHFSLKGHQVFGKHPHPNSMAAHILYKRWLAGLEFMSECSCWGKFRFEFLNSQKSLSCVYCNKENLQIFTQLSDRLATIDHILPVSKGGSKYDVSNLIVACEPCNSSKSDKLPLEFLMGFVKKAA